MDELGRKQLASWGVSERTASQAGLFQTPSAQQLYNEMEARAALVIPYYDKRGQLIYFNRGGTALPFGRLRLLGDDPHQVNGFTKPKGLRYLQPKQSPLLPYLMPGLNWPEIMQNADIPLIITEGEAKAMKGIEEGFTVVALGGVFSFTTKAGDLLPELEEFNWRGRSVYVVYDSDAATNPNVLAAEARLVDELQRKRMAKCHLVRLPQAEKKMGMDDYIVAHGAAAFEGMLRTAPPLNALDNKVLDLNKDVAWIEREGMVYDLHSKLFIGKDNFTKGSRYSAIKHITVGAGQRAAPKEVSVAEKWLTHAYAQRFDEILFRPNEAEVIRGEFGRSALNMWTGFDEHTPGNVQPFLDLTTHIFSNMGKDAELPFKTMIYKAQNPEQKIPLALVMVGPQGSGKTMWAEIIRDAFSPYGIDVAPSSLGGEFKGWLEKSLVAVVNEAKGDDMQKALQQLYALISDLRANMNEKYRPQREINSYTFYIITANDRRVGSFSADDRRMIVVDAPNPKPPEFYDELLRWRRAGGAKHLLNWMLNYDLQGWKPPARAPLSAEKYIAFTESLTPIQKLAEDMKTSDQNTIVSWLEQARDWARAAEVSNSPGMQSVARATLDGVRNFQVRPWYTPQELALMFPSVVMNVQGSKYNQNLPAGQISRELREAGIPYLVCADDPRGFMWKGRISQFLVVADFAEWSQPLRQSDFDRYMSHWPSFEQFVRFVR